MSSILTNNSAMVALDTLRSINSNLSGVQSEISTGKKISTSTDNAAIWSISTVMESDVKSFDQVSDSLNLGSATVGVAQNGASEVTELLTDVKAAIVAASDPSVSDSDRSKYQTDISEYAATISSIVDAASFNGTNLLKGTEDIEVLSSLNRQDDGTVTAGKVSVARQDLSTDAAKVATAAVLASTADGTDAGAVSFADGTVDAGIQAATVTDASDGGITFADGTATAGATELGTVNGGPEAVTAGSVYSFDVGTASISYTAQEGDDINAVNEGIVDAINDAGITNVSAAVTAAAGDPLVDDATFTITNGTASDIDVDESTSTSIAAQAATELGTINGGAGSVTVGSEYTFDVGGTDVSYTAVEGDDINSVNEGVVAAINAAGISGITAEVTTPADDATTDDATFTISNSSAVGVAANNGVTNIAAADAIVDTAAGGLAALADIDVTTIDGATDALAAIDGLLQTAIDATAQFGSKQQRLENQNEFISTLSDSLKTGIGAMTDANLEEASARLQSLQVQQQLGVQALSIANQGPQQLLSLFR